MFEYQIINKLGFVSVILLSGCAASLPPYVEPDPAREPTARLRTVVVAGVNATVLLHRNNANGICLVESEAVAIPVHTNVSGFAGESKKKIGMPFINSYSEKIGSEIYIPAKGDLTISASFSGAGSVYGASCRMAFRFKPLADKNYQLFIQAGQQQGGRGVCVLEFQEIVEDLASHKLSQRDVERTPILVKGSPAWKTFCANESN